MRGQIEWELYEWKQNRFYAQNLQIHHQNTTTTSHSLGRPTTSTKSEWGDYYTGIQMLCRSSADYQSAVCGYIGEWAESRTRWICLWFIHEFSEFTPPLALISGYGWMVYWQNTKSDSQEIPTPPPSPTDHRAVAILGSSDSTLAAEHDPVIILLHYKYGDERRQRRQQRGRGLMVVNSFDFCQMTYDPNIRATSSHTRPLSG